MVPGHTEKDKKVPDSKITSVGLFMNLLTSVSGMGIALYLGTHWIENQDKKFDILFKKLDGYQEKENKDIQCLTARMYRCCGERADASC